MREPGHRLADAPSTGSDGPLGALRRRVERMLDSDRLLPADGQALLQMLQEAQKRLAHGEAGQAGGLLLGFEALLRALTESGVLDPAASDLCLTEVRAASAALDS